MGTTEQHHADGLLRLDAAREHVGEGRLQVGAAFATLAVADFEAANVQLGIDIRDRAPQRPFDDPREVRAWCLDRAVQARGWSDRKDIGKVLGMAEAIRVYVTTGEIPAEPDTSDEATDG